jgi:hypothetical protein
MFDYCIGVHETKMGDSHLEKYFAKPSVGEALKSCLPPRAIVGSEIRFEGLN